MNRNSKKNNKNKRESNLGDRNLHEYAHSDVDDRHDGI